MIALVRRIVALLAVLAVCGPGIARAADVRQNVFAVQINGTAVTNGAVILEKPDGTLLASQADLDAWNLSLAGRIPELVFEEQPYFALSGFAGLTATVDAANQLLIITAPGTLFVSKTIDVGASRGRLPAFDGTRGGFLNYSVENEHVVRNDLSTGLVTLGYTGLPGGAVITSDFVGSAATGQQSRFGRLGTTYRRDDLSNDSTLRIGDSVTSAGRLGTPVAFFGIQRSTDFSLDPSLLVFPSVSATGISQAQSTVDVYVNGVQTSAQHVAAGPFTVSNLPVLDGQGDITLVVKDIFGREHVIVTPFYYTRSLLKNGLTESSYEAGILRRDFGTGLGSYGTGMVSGTYRHGFSDRFTGEAHLEASQSGHLADVAGDLLVKRLGVFHAAFGQSSSLAGSGVRALLGYDYSSYRGVSLFLNGDYQGAEFASLGQTPLGATAITTTEGIRKVFAHGRALSVALVQRHVANSAYFSSASLGLTMPAAGGYVGFSLTKAFTTGAAGVGVQFYRQLGPRGSIDSQAIAGDGQFNRVAYHESLPDTGLGTGYDVGAGNNGGAEIDADVYQRSPYGFGRARAILTRGDAPATDIAWSGGLSVVDGRLRASDTINNSYGLVLLPGIPNVRVYSNGRLVGRTNARGEAFIPSLSPYVTNDVEIDPRDVPLDVNVDNYIKHVKPYARNASIIRFTAHRSGGVTIRAVGADGIPLPIGTRLSSGGEEPWLVAREGAAYLRGVRHGLVTIDADTGSGSCRMTIRVPDDTSGLPDLGEQKCGSAAAVVQTAPLPPAALPSAAPAYDSVVPPAAGPAGAGTRYRAPQRHAVSSLVAYTYAHRPAAFARPHGRAAVLPSGRHGCRRKLSLRDHDC